MKGRDGFRYSVASIYLYDTEKLSKTAKQLDRVNQIPQLLVELKIENKLPFTKKKNNNDNEYNDNNCNNHSNELSSEVAQTKFFQVSGESPLGPTHLKPLFISSLRSLMSR